MGTDEEIDRYVGSRLAGLRRARRATQTQLGNALGVTFQQIQKYESGRNRISPSKLVRAAAFLDVHVVYFFSGAPGVSPLDSALKQVRKTEDRTGRTVSSDS